LFSAAWGRTHDLTSTNLQSLNDDNCVLLLGSFLCDVNAGNNMVQSGDLKAQTLDQLSFSGPRFFLQVVLVRPVNIYDTQSLARQPRYHPFLGQQLAERRKWAQPTAKKEPFILADMFQWLHDRLLADPNPTAVFFGWELCVYDWMRLGLFTGFPHLRISPIPPQCRTPIPSHSRFVRCPSNLPEDPLGFRTERFSFL
jgi:hypothetical protein